MITLHTAAGTTRDLTHARTRETRQRLDRQQYRPPFSTTWRTTGTGNPEAERVSITVEVWGGSLAALRPTLTAITADAEDATSIETPLGDWALTGLVSAIRTPIESGYRLDLTWLASGPRVPSGAYGHGAYGAGAYGGTT